MHACACERKRERKTLGVILLALLKRESTQKRQTDINARRDKENEDKANENREWEKKRQEKIY